MRKIRRLVAPILALALTTSLIAPALAQDLSIGDPSPGVTTSPAPPDESTPAVTSDSVIGALAAAGCGFFIRVTLATGGSQVGTIVGAVACCLYAALDAACFDPH